MKFASQLAIAAFSLTACAAAQAVVIKYDYVTPLDGSGKTSALAGTANTSSGNVFVETFDRADGTGGLTMSSSLVKVSTLSGGGIGYAQGSLASVYATPANDTTHFAYGPDKSSSVSNASVRFDYAGLLGTLGANASLNYFGLYYGSIDTYNDVTFYNAAGNVIQTVTGTDLINQFKGTSGNQTGDSSNLYVNLYFTAAEQFSSFSFSTTSRAFEMDNLVVGYQVSAPGAVPEPASLALVGLGLTGLAGLGALRRRKQK